MAPAKKQLIQSVVASIAAVVPPATQLLGLILIWGINISRQKTAIITMLEKKPKYFRERLAGKRLNVLHRKPRSKTGVQIYGGKICGMA